MRARLHFAACRYASKKSFRLACKRDVKFGNYESAKPQGMSVSQELGSSLSCTRASKSCVTTSLPQELVAQILLEMRRQLSQLQA